MTLPEAEPGPREVLIKDFVKRCWGIQLARGSVVMESTAAADVQSTEDTVVSEVVPLISPKVSLVPSTEAQLSGPPLVSSALAKFITDTGLDAEAAYAAYVLQVAQLAERRDKELCGLNDDIEKVRKDREAFAAGQKRDRLIRESLEQD